MQKVFFIDDPGGKTKVQLHEQHQTETGFEYKNQTNRTNQDQLNRMIN